MDQIKYISIPRLGHKSTVGMFEAGDSIVVTEKVDCSNASFTVDELGELRVFSRNVELDESNTLNGFYQWVHENIDPTRLVMDFLYFGEWLGTPHKVRYEGLEKQFILFDVWDKEEHKYVPLGEVKLEAKYLGLNLVPVFYEGPFISFEHLEGLVGKTAIGGRIGETESGEGIVVKNYKKQAFAKMVTDAFREVHRGAKPYRIPAEKGAEGIFIDETVTPARVEKIYFKLVDEGVLAPDLAIEDMGTILKALVPAIKDDILKEEIDLLPEGYDPKVLGKSLSKKVPPLIRNIVIEQERA